MFLHPTIHDISTCSPSQRPPMLSQQWKRWSELCHTWREYHLLCGSTAQWCCETWTHIRERNKKKIPPPPRKGLAVISDLSCPAVSQSCSAIVVEPRVKVFILKSIPENNKGPWFHTLRTHRGAVGNHCERLIKTENLTNSSAHFTVEVSCAVLLDEGALTHLWITQEYHLEHSLRTDNFALKFR